LQVRGEGGATVKEIVMPDRDLTPYSGRRGLSTYEQDPFEAFRRRMDHLFDAFWSPVESRSFAPPAQTRWLSIDLNETDQAYTVAAEMPGIEDKDVDLTLRDNTLTIRGEKRDERKDGDGGRVYIERSYGRFERTIPFESEVDADKVVASRKNGVLTVTLPKNPEAKDKIRRIPIKPQASS
jgi:HSP20 family protein